MILKLCEMRGKIEKKEATFVASERDQGLEIFDKQSTYSVQNGQNHDTDVGENGHPHVGDTKCAENQASNFDADGKPNIFFDDCQTLARDLDAFGNL